MEAQLFNLRFTSKQLQRQSRKCEKNEKQNKLRLKKAIEKGNMDGAKIYAENAIREKNQALNYLRLASRIDAVAARVETAIRMKNVTRSMAGIVRSLDRASQSMNVEQITKVMDQFERQFEDLDVQATYVEGAMNQTTTLSTPQDQVEELISQVADEHGLELAGTLGEKAAVPSTAAATTTNEQDDLMARLDKLKARS
ncbi:Charged multivesicular body protein 1a [Balamuthia mandrillaris]